MRFATVIVSNNKTRLVLMREDDALDLQPAGFEDLLQLIAAGDEGLQRIRVFAVSEQSPGVPSAQCRFAAPLERPPRVFGIGLNYQEHAAESKMQVQKVPTVFMKLPSALVGSGGEIVLPATAKEPDYEAELAVVIGKGGYRIAAAKAEQHVFGYTIANDVSARDVQLATSQWTLGKSFPTFLPMGPAVVTKDEISDPHALAIRLEINGEALQQSNTSQLLFPIPRLIEYISSITPLEAGDVILTGTPSGVGMGREPKRWMRPGEEIVITIEGLGVLRNRTVAEGADTAGASAAAPLLKGPG